MSGTGLSWYHTDEGILPDAAAANWAKVGTGTATIGAQGVQIIATTEAGYFVRRPGQDGAAVYNRRSDRLEIQLRARVRSYTAGWASGASPVVLAMDDGVRAVGVSIDSTLKWIDPYTGVVLQEIRAGFPSLRTSDFHLVKDRGDRWQLYVNGRLESTLPYLAAADGVKDAYLWGSLDPAASSDSDWEGVETGFNTDLPPQWKVDRIRLAAPNPIKKVWNKRWRALARMMVGVTQEAQNALDVAYRLTTAARTVMQRAAFAGEVLPSLVDPPWGLTVPGDVSIVRGRVRVSALGGASLISFTPEPYRLDGELRIAATFQVIDSTPLFTRVGPGLLLVDGTRRVAAELIEVAPDQRGWVLTTGNFVFAPVIVGNVWLVDESRPHRVEVQVLGRAGSVRPRVLLLVDGRVVDDQPYGAFTYAGGFNLACVSRNAPCTFDLETVEMEVRYADLAARAIFQQTVSERVVFAAGCERNDHLETLVRAHYGLNDLRGTNQGILIEIRRLSCDDRSTITTTTDEAQWYLEVSYPELTPIFLEAEGQLSDIVVEFHDGAPNFTSQELADLAATYLVPISVLEMQWSIAVAAQLTANTVSGAGETTFTVDDPTPFAIDDLVELRDAAAVVYEYATITDLNLTTGDVTTTLLTNSFIVADIMRKTLATT